MEVFHPEYRRYAHVLVDIAFDHLLIENWKKYSNMEFHIFVEHVYAILKTKRAILPPSFMPVADRMRREDWLSSYESLTGLATAYERIACRIGIETGHLAKSADIVEEKRDFLSIQFNSLFPKLMKAAQA